jgi:Tfp pilus assembly protein FimT
LLYGKEVTFRQRIAPFFNEANMDTRFSSRGFSLVEALVILAIIGILMGLSAMALSNYLPYSNLKRAARTIVSMMQTARMEAIKRNTRVAIVFNNATQGCTIYTSPGPDNNWNTENDNEPYRSFTLTNLRGGISFGHGAATQSVSGTPFSSNSTNLPPNSRIVFTPRGGVAGSLGTVYIQDQRGASMAITTRSLAGSLLVRQWEGNQWR